MFGGESEDAYIGKILKKLSTGKTLKHILLELTWSERAKLLQRLKVIRKCQGEFDSIMKTE